MIVFWYMLSELFPERSGDLYEAYWRYGEAAMLGVYVCMVGLKGRVEEKLFAAYAVWMLVSRWLNGDILLRTDFWQVITAFESLLVFAAGLRLEPRQRRRLLNCFAIIYLLFFTALGAAGIFVALTNTCINIPPEYVCIRVGTVSGNALSFFSKTNTVSCMWFFIAWCLAVNMFFSVRHISWRVLLGLDALLLHVALTLCHGRASQVALSIGYAMLVMLLALRLIKCGGIKRSLLLAAAAIAAFGLSFASYKPISAAVTELHKFTAPRFESFYTGLDRKLYYEYFDFASGAMRAAAEAGDAGTGAAAEEKAESDSEPSEFSITDHRKISKNFTLSERTYIWEAVGPAVRARPSILLTGQRQGETMTFINQYLQEQYPGIGYKPHMHNMFFQVLMLLGLPGLLIVLAWTILMVVKMVRVFFSKKEAAGMLVKTLTIAPAGVLVYNLAEVFGFAGAHLTGNCFFLLSGIFLGFYYDCFPGDEGMTALRLRRRG